MAKQLYDDLVAATLPLDGTEEMLVGNQKATVDDIAARAWVPRVITADATLAATDRIVIIDSADPTISLTLDAGSATRGRCEILWAGEPSGPRTLTLVRAGGTGTIDGVSASKVVTGRAKLAVYATGAGEWFTDAGETTQTVTSSPATVSAKIVVLDDDGHTAMSPGTLVMPPITPGAVHLIVTPYENVHYEIIKNPDDPLYTGPDYDVDSSFARQQVIPIVAAESEGVLRWQYDSTGYYINTLFVALMAIGVRMDDAETAIGILAADVPVIDGRLDALEAIATTPVSSTTGTTLSWEAQERVRVANTGTTHCLVTLNGDTTEWPVGRARAISQYGSTTGGFTIAVPSGHKLNTVTNGTSGVIGTSAAAAGTALYTVMVTREASDEWSWA